MSSLYRKYRPQVFADLIGQDHIRQVLQNALRQDKLSHAYLFSGPRGTGKTTTARLLARGANCPNRKENIDPCNKCPICLEITESRAVDIIEIDAASNRGIDEIRDLREKIALSPMRAKFKVYIIDEVHMLTKEAFNALLKTLEEPPAHAILILATTELHRVPETIVSRCQRYHFHPASPDELVKLLKTIAKKEKILIDGEGLGLIALRAEGSYRDALTLLGSLGSSEGELTSERIRQLIGLPPRETIEGLVRSIRASDSGALITQVRDLLVAGDDLLVVIKMLADVLKLEILSGADTAGVSGSLLEDLLLILARSRLAADPTAMALSGLIRLTCSTAPKIQSVKPIMTDLAPSDSIPTMAVDAVQAVVGPSDSTTIKTAETSDFWEQLLAEVKNHNHALYAVVRAASLGSLTQDKLTIAVPFKFYQDRLQELKNRHLIEKIAKQLTNKKITLDCKVKPAAKMPTESNGAADELMKNVVDVFELEEES